MFSNTVQTGLLNSFNKENMEMLKYREPQNVLNIDLRQEIWLYSRELLPTKS